MKLKNNKTNKNIFIQDKQCMLKYRCEKCNSILFEGEDVSGTIKIKCKHICKATDKHPRHKCDTWNTITGD